MFKILENCKMLDLEVNNKTRQIPDSPPPQQGASDPISGLTTSLDKSPWDNTAIFIFFCHFSVPS